MKYIQPIAATKSDGLTAEVYKQIKRDFGALVEPYTLHSPAPQLLAGIWITTRETELAGSVDRDIKEAVAATVSRINQCPYCVDAHTMMLHATSAHGLAKAISDERNDLINDPKLRKIVSWAAATGFRDDPALSTPPFSETEMPEIVGTAVVFHYINRMVNIFLSETPLPFNRYGLKNPLKRLAGLYFSQAASRPKPAGESLELLPLAELPSDMAWASPSQVVAGAFARFAAVNEAAGSNALPDDVRVLVNERVATWNGEDPGIDRSWLEESICGLGDSSKKKARLALLTALSPHQVDESIVEDYRTFHSSDEALIETIAWSSFTAARRVGTWLFKQ